MLEGSDLARALTLARRALVILEEQAASYTFATIPVHVQLQLEEKRREVAALEARTRATPDAEGYTHTEDGLPLNGSPAPAAPSPAFDERFVNDLLAPGGAVKLSDALYIRREVDAQFYNELGHAGVTVSIRAPRQSGKTSLLVRGLDRARQRGSALVHVNLQRVDVACLQSLDDFLHYLALFIQRRLRFTAPDWERQWAAPLPPGEKLTFFMEDHVLARAPEQSLILAFDEADRLLEKPWHTDFFALLRSWHEERALSPQWNALNLALVISTEPYLLIANEHQSPFNVGLRLVLEDFSPAYVADLNARHGAPIQDADFLAFTRLFGGHPYLCRQALYELVKQRRSWAALARVAAREDGPFGEHLRHYRQLVEADAALRAALVDIIRRGRCADDAARFRLLRAGLLTDVGDGCGCRCELYHRYFEATL